MCVCVSPILSGKTVFADCKFYEFDWGAANEPYWRISLSSSSSCRLPADKGRREAVVDQQCGIHEIHFEKGWGNTRSSKNPPCLSSWKIAPHFPHVTFPRSWARSNCQDWKILKFVKVSHSANAFSPCPTQTGNDDECQNSSQIHPLHTIRSISQIWSTFPTHLNHLISPIC